MRVNGRHVRKAEAPTLIHAVRKWAAATAALGKLTAKLPIKDSSQACDCCGLFTGDRSRCRYITASENGA